MKIKTLIVFFLLCALSACQSTADTPEEAATLVVMTHDSFEISAEVVDMFEEENGVKIQFIKAGDTGSALNKAILSGDNPIADVFYGVDNTFLSRALEEEIFLPYKPEALEEIDSLFILDPTFQAVPVDYSDVCLNFDRAYFENNQLSAPQTLEDLLKPEYEGMLVVENPALSSPGLAFLLATISQYGEDGYLEYWQSLVENDVLVVNDWETAYYSEYSLWGGERPIVVSYSSSPPFEFIFAETPLEEPPSAAVAGDGACIRQIEFAGILKGTSRLELAQKWIDFMLSPAFQGDMPINMAVFPVLPGVDIDDAFETYMQTSEVLSMVPFTAIAENRESWIKAWTEAVLR